MPEFPTLSNKVHGIMTINIYKKIVIIFNNLTKTPFSFRHSSNTIAIHQQLSPQEPYGTNHHRFYKHNILILLQISHLLLLQKVLIIK